MLLTALHDAPRLRPRNRKHMVIRSYSGHYHLEVGSTSLATASRGRAVAWGQARGAPPVRGQGW